MRASPAAALLAAWERGAAEPPVGRGLVLLGLAAPERARDELAALPLAERDRLLLALRAAAAGPELVGYAECPACSERLEFALDGAALGGAGPPPPGAEWEATGGGLTMRFRLPDSRDLAAATACVSVEAARRTLAARCVLGARDAAGAPVDALADALPDAAVAALAARMDEVAPGTCVTLAVTCPACAAAWDAPLDVPAFVWAELEAQARRLLREVDALARAYHWGEADILALSPARRRAYLELAGA